MKYKNICLIFLFATIMVSLSSCNKTTNLSGADKAKPLEDPNTKTAAFPHEKDFFKNHGAKYLADKEQCLGCHSKEGGGAAAAVSCTQCHESYPHNNFLSANGDQHSAAYLKNPQSCSKCHGEDWQGGKAGVSCFKCHEGYPHAKKWANPEQHGKFFVGLTEKQQCLSCHDPKKPEAAATQCNHCHKAYPHEKRFKNGGKPHKQMASSYEGKCLVCHRDYKENMPNLQKPEEGVGCMNCHSGEIEVIWKETPPPEPKDPAKPDINGKLNTAKTRLPSNSSTGKKYHKTPAKTKTKTESEK